MWTRAFPCKRRQGKFGDGTSASSEFAEAEGAMKLRRQTGYAIILTMLVLVALLGFMGFAIDMGMMRYERRLQQTAADAAAIAGANDLAFEGSGSVQSAAQNAATANGFTDGANNVTVTVNNPPSYWSADPHIGDAKYVEVVVTAIHPTYFEKIVGINNETVLARAEATNLSGDSNTNPCMFEVGDPANEIGLDGSGSATINATSCGIVDNGNFKPTGAALRVNTCSFNVSGANTGNNTSDVQCNGGTFTPSYSSPTAQDPLLGRLTPPAIGAPQACCAGKSTVTPGTYSGMTIGSNQTVNFQPGIYVVTQNDFSCGGGSTITGYGVMFYFTNGATINCQGNVNATLGAPCGSAGCKCDTATSQSCYCSTCASQYDGILMWQDASDTNTGIPTVGNKPPCPPPGSGNNTGPELGGNASSSYWGVLYFPADQLYMTGNVKAGITPQLNIAAEVSFSACIGGNTTLNLLGTSGLPTPFPTLSNTVLVE